MTVRPPNIDRVRQTLFVRHGKGARDRYVPLGARAAGWVDTYLCHARPHLVTRPDAGLLFVSATGMLEGGADIRYVAELLGHARLETTQIYTSVSIDELTEVHAEPTPPPAKHYDGPHGHMRVLHVGHVRDRRTRGDLGERHREVRVEQTSGMTARDF